MEISSYVLEEEEILEEIYPKIEVYEDELDNLEEAYCFEEQEQVL